MLVNRFKIFLIPLFMVLGATATAQPLPYKDPSLPIPARVADLLSRMTLEEKIGQLNVLLGWEMYEHNNAPAPSQKFKDAVAQQHIGMLWATLRADPWTQKTLATGLNPYTAALATNALQKWNLEHSRLQIPIFFAEEAPHGHMAIGTTVFPTAIGQASTWNPETIRGMASIIARETRVQGAHIGYGPVLDLARDPRWSRVEETYGEDSFLTAAMGKAMVQGFQGDAIGSPLKLIATLKHFVAYGIPEGGHNGGAVNTGTRNLFQHYLPPFKAAVRAGAGSVMTAYNSIDGIPCSSNELLLRSVLRDSWKFKGFTVSDLNSIPGLKNVDKVAADYTAAAALALNAGLDADLGAAVYTGSLKEALANKTITIDRVNEAVERVLRKKMEMGLFEQPYADPVLSPTIVRNAEALASALKVSRESLVLLKNEKGTLPLRKDLRRIAVIGPNADNPYNQLGDYTAPQPRSAVVTVLDGIRVKMPNARVEYVKGAAIRDTSETNIAEAVAAAQRAEAVIVVLGGSSARDFKTTYAATGAATPDREVVSDMESGEGFDRASLDLLGDQLALLKAIVKTGKPVVLVMIQGRPLNLNWPAENVPAILNAWYPGAQGGHAIADVLFGDYNPAGRLPISIPRSVGQLPVYYSFQNGTRHDYVECSAEPLYPFGFGLSYTQFQYSDLKITKTESADQLLIRVSFRVTNVGKDAGDEVAQLYIKDDIGSVVLPNKLLKDFERIKLAAGEQRQVYFELGAADLSIFNAALKEVAEKGTFTIQVGGSSANLPLQGTIELNYDHYVPL